MCWLERERKNNNKGKQYFAIKCVNGLIESQRHFDLFAIDLPDTIKCTMYYFHSD